MSFLAMILAVHPLWALAHEKTPLRKGFTENLGQWKEDFLFKARFENGAAFIEKNGITYHLADLKWREGSHLEHPADGKGFKASVLKTQWKNTSDNIRFEKLNPCTYYENYYLGKNHHAWKSHLFPFSTVLAKSVWDKIDIEINLLDHAIKTNYLLKPGANPEDIQIEFPGFHKAYVRKSDGALIFPLSFMELAEEKPFAYQWVNGEKKEIQCRYVLRGNLLTFQLENYDKSQELIIDPVLVFASYTGSTSDNFGFTATYDNQGKLYAGGIVFNAGYPLTNGAFDTTYTGLVAFGSCDVGISVFDSTGSSLIYSTYLGGTGTEEVSSLVVNGNNELFAFGVTGSSDFPIGTQAYDSSFQGGPPLSFNSNGTVFNQGTDIYVSRFSSDGTGLLASTFIGGSDNEGANNSPLVYNYGDYFRGEINLDNFGNVYVGTCTYSNDFPVSSGAIQSSLTGGIEGVVFKLNPQLSQLLGSTYLGGLNDDAIYSVTVDDSSHVLVTGGTTSTTLPSMQNGWQSNFQGGLSDGFVYRISPNFNAIIAGSFVGTSEYDQSFFIQTDKNHQVYLFGQTLGNFPVSQGVYSNPGSTQFLVKFDSLLTNPVYSSVFGNGSASAGEVNISPTAFLVDVCENVYISGWGGNILTGIPTNNMPLSNDAFQNATDGFNFYLAVFEKDLQSLLYGTYFGGPTSREHVDGGTSRFDKRGIVYQSVCAGCGGNDDFPTSPNSWSQTNGAANCNNGLFKFDFQIRLAVADFTPSTFTGCAPLTVQFNNNSSNTSQFLWDFGGLGGGFANDTSFTFTQPGNYLVKLIASDTLSCNGADTTFRWIQVTNGPQVNFNYANNACSNSVSFTANQVTGAPVNNWQWNFGDGQSGTGAGITHDYLSPGSYTVELIATDINGCSDTIQQIISFNGYTASGTGLALCDYQAQFQMLTPGINAQQWLFNDPGNPGASSNLASPSFQFSDSGTYQVDLIIFYGPGNSCSDTLSITLNIPKPIDPGFEIIQPNCNNQFIFQDTSIQNSTSQTVQLQWLLNGLPVSGVSPYNRSLAAGLQNVMLIITDQRGCTDSVLQTLNIPSYNFLNTLSDSALCEAGMINLSASGANSYLWTPTDLFDDPTQANQSITLTETETISLQASFTDINGNPCVVTDSAQFTVVWPGPFDLSISADPDTMVSGQSATLTLNGTVLSPFFWSPEVNSTGAQASPVVVNPDSTTTYTFFTGPNGACRRTESVKITVFRSPCLGGELFIPNTFTPNQDGKNDVFRPRGFGIYNVKFRVYNRWGEKIFESDDLNSGWDGSYKGKPADPGVYACYLEYSCLVLESASFVEKGNVTLIR